jgi:hypothetical protein
MKIGVLGTGMVGQAIAGKLAALGHEKKMGARFARDLRGRGGFGWKSVIDLGDITAARATEAYLLLWLRLWGVLHTADFNIHIVR